MYLTFSVCVCFSHGLCAEVRGFPSTMLVQGQNVDPDRNDLNDKLFTLARDFSVTPLRVVGCYFWQLCCTRWKDMTKEHSSHPNCQEAERRKELGRRCITWRHAPRKTHPSPGSAS